MNVDSAMSVPVSELSATSLAPTELTPRLLAPIELFWMSPPVSEPPRTSGPPRESSLISAPVSVFGATSELNTELSPSSLSLIAPAAILVEPVSGLSVSSAIASAAILALPTAPVAISGLPTAPAATSADFTSPLTMSSVNTVFMPSSAYAEPIVSEKNRAK